MKRERVVFHDQLHFWTESFGSEKDPCILLIMGATCQAIFWPQAYCEALANLGFFVIRYDNRDVGKSSVIDFQKNPYTLETLTEDALHILDAYSIEKAHLCGASMGGMIATRLALSFPERVLSLTLIMSTGDHKPLTDALAGRDLSKHSLPPPSNSFIEFFKKFKPLENEEEFIAAGVLLLCLLNGTEAPFNQKEAKNFQELSFRRKQSSISMLNHFYACDLSTPCLDKLDKIKVPTLIIHGASDPLIPLAHAKAMKEKMKEAKLVIIPEMGHYISEEFSRKIFEEQRSLLFHDTSKTL